MDVELYVYDLSKGLARQMSQAFLGTQIDAVYHTSLVFGGIEYLFGAGVQTCYPGTTHHGQPMEKIHLGATQLPMELILEYLDTLKTIYTAESYDLFMHNCNNFSNDFATFLVGKGIPEHITSLPQTVLNTPFGQMLKPQLDQAMRSVTQASVAPASIPNRQSQPQVPNGNKASLSRGTVHKVTSLKELQGLLESAKSKCAVIFFTSSTCPPCKMCYEPYDRLAEEFANEAVLIKVDCDSAMEVASVYNVRATPTFTTFLKGEKHQEWSGADPTELSANVKMLVQMANPPHPHRLLSLPKLQKPYRPDLYNAIPPLDKLVTKLGPIGQSAEVQELKNFVQTRSKEGAVDAPLPDLKSISHFLKVTIEAGQTDNLFALIDLVRASLIDPRVSGYFAKDPSSVLYALIDLVCDWESSAMNSTKLVTVQMACNMFSSPLLTHHLDKGAHTMVHLATWLLLNDDSSTKIRECTASLILNIAKTVHSYRLEGQSPSLSESSQVELIVCLLESIQRSQEVEVLKRSALAIGLLVFCCPQDGELREILSGMDALSTFQNSQPLKDAVEKSLFDDVSQVLTQKLSTS